MTAADLRALLEYVPGKTKTRDMTDGEIRRELKDAKGERLDALHAEVADRKRLRASEGKSYPVEPLLAGLISCHRDGMRRASHGK